MDSLLRKRLLDPREGRLMILTNVTRSFATTLHNRYGLLRICRIDLYEGRVSTAYYEDLWQLYSIRQFPLAFADMASPGTHCIRSDNVIQFILNVARGALGSRAGPCRIFGRITSDEERWADMDALEFYGGSQSVICGHPLIATTRLLFLLGKNHPWLSAGAESD